MDERGREGVNEREWVKEWINTGEVKSRANVLHKSMHMALVRWFS